MTSNEVRQLVERQIGNQWDRSNPHHVDLRTALIPPRSLTFVRAGDETEVSAWLVLLEDPKVHLGFGVAYDEASGSFGLVQFAAGYEPCLIGLYGGFFDAFEAM